jgi:hypothetical protein
MPRITVYAVRLVDTTCVSRIPMRMDHSIVMFDSAECDQYTVVTLPTAG